MEPDEKTEEQHKKTLFQKIADVIFGEVDEIPDDIEILSAVEEEGEPEAVKVDLSDLTEVQKEYRRLLKKVWEDRHLSMAESDFLRELGSTQCISPEEHQAIEKDVLKEIKETKQECPHCGSAQVYDEEKAGWFCKSCGEYQFLD